MFHNLLVLLPSVPSTGFLSARDLLHQHYLPCGYVSVCHVGIYLKPSQCQQRNTERNPFVPMYDISGLGLLTLFWGLNVNWLQADWYLFSQCIAVCSIKNLKYFESTVYQMYSLVSVTVDDISNCYVRMKIFWSFPSNYPACNWLESLSYFVLKY